MKFTVEESYFNGTEELEEKINARVRAALRESIVNIIETGDYFLGEGATAEVHFLDNNPDICYKVIRNTEVMARPDAIDSLPEKYRAIYEDKNKGKAKRTIGAPDDETPWHLPLEEEMVIQNKAAKIDGDVKVPVCYGKIVVDGVEEGEGYEVRDSLSCLVMERVRGVTVSDIIMKKMPLPEGFSIEEFKKKVEEFVESMHEGRIYHRDLHDGNVMIEEGTGRPYIIDFGRSTVLGFSTDEPYVDESIEGEKHRFPKDEVMFQNKVVKQLEEYEKYLNLTKLPN